HNLGAPPAVGLASKAVMAVVLLHLTLQRNGLVRLSWQWMLLLCLRHRIPIPWELGS
ncbi:unnamed protein product, partial [Musa acuminata subsp. burmannicoides]